MYADMCVHIVVRFALRPIWACACVRAAYACVYMRAYIFVNVCIHKVMWPVFGLSARVHRCSVASVCLRVYERAYIFVRTRVCVCACVCVVTCPRRARWARGACQRARARRAGWRDAPLWWGWTSSPPSCPSPGHVRLLFIGNWGGAQQEMSCGKTGAARLTLMRKVLVIHCTST